MSTSGKQLRNDLCEAARSFHARGWMAGTAGNLSARLPDGSFWITASGRAKGALKDKDFLRISAGGEVVERFADSDRPSAETTLHKAVYDLVPEARACYHVHTVEACLVSHLANPFTHHLRLPPLEMVKGLGIWEFEPEVYIDVFANLLAVPDIARNVVERFAASPPHVPGFLIRDHGITAWGDSTQQAFDRVELFEYIFRYLIAAHRAGIWKEQ